jgi:carboxy-cis,cis-muconate cyclase
MAVHLLVGTFNTPAVFTLAFDPAARSLAVAAVSDATGPHSWLSLNPARTVVYATAWTAPPGLAAYRIERDPAGIPSLALLNSVTTAARSGYCCNSPLAVYSAGGPTGEVFSIDPDTGAFTEGRELQKLHFVDDNGQQDNGGTMDFGGLRHGAHSADLSPDGKLLYIADMSVAGAVRRLDMTRELTARAAAAVAGTASSSTKSPRMDR